MSVSSSLIAKHGETIIRRRPTSAPVIDSKGRISHPTESILEIIAYVEPATGEQLKRLKEGLRTNNVVAVFTNEHLTCGDMITATKPDRLTIRDELYEVVSVLNFSTAKNHNLLHYEALAVKVS